MERPSTTILIGSSTVNILDGVVRDYETEWTFIVPPNFKVEANIDLTGGQINFSCNQ